MKFECLNLKCQKKFLFTAKLIKEKKYATDEAFNKGDVIETEDVVETHVCPYCQSLDFQEYVEPAIVEKISSVKSVELDKVDEMITQGYEVKELYAKTATMIKKEKQDNVTIPRKQLEEMLAEFKADGTAFLQKYGYCQIEKLLEESK